MFQRKVLEKTEIHFMFNDTPPQKIVPFMRECEKKNVVTHTGYEDDSIIRRMRIACRVT